MDIVKSHWSASEDRVSLSVPISKVDRVNRLVSGFATLDNVDTSDDVVTAEASRSAFTRFRGNVREMHEPIAAGRVVDFKEDSYYDAKTDKFYNGIYVTAYVSMGAENTWQKVLDGTLSGFSIGGNITKKSVQYVPDLEKSIRYIEDYDLVELSLVDNPANQLSNIFSIVKNQEGTLIKGMVSDTHLINVFWCDKDEIAKNSDEESADCNACGEKMVQIEWFERGSDDAVKTAAAVANFLRQKEDGAVNNTQNQGEGGVDMTDEVTKNADEEGVVTSGDVNDGTVSGNVEEQGNERAEAEREAEAEGEVLSEDEAVETEESVEEAASEPDFEKMFDDLKDSVKDSVEKTVQAVEQKVADATAAFDEKASEFEKSLGELGEELKAIKDAREDVAKRLDALEKASAIKKSGEVETTVEPVEKTKKGLWGGAFFDGE